VVSQVIQTWDTGFKTTAGSAYSVCQTWGRGPFGFILLDRFRERLEWPDLERKVIQLYNEQRPQAVLIEDRASGQSLIQSLNRNTSIPIIPIQAVLDKVLRARVVSPLFEAGRVWVPDSSIAPWIGEVVDFWASFPNTKFLDDTDAMSQVLQYWLAQALSGAIRSGNKRVVRPTMADFRLLDHAHRLWR
jgi:predicted phage terminase large subunit-like protein